MKKLLATFLFGATLFAQQPDVIVVAPPNWLLTPERIQVFDDRVFNLDVDRTEKTSVNIRNRARYVGDRVGNTRTQRDEALASCETLRDNMPKFRACFQAALKRLR